jgi:ubiquinone/menaquinone biosynthesis C-methylase UbiE
MRSTTRSTRPSRLRPLASLALLLAACTTKDAAVATPPAAAPAVDVAKINQPFRELADVPSWTAKFERESREVYAKRLEIAEAVRLEPGMHVADLGAGTGLFEPILSLLVGPAGRIYAVDIALLFVEHVRRRAIAESLPNVVSLPCTDDATGLADGSVDLVFACDVYHHFEHPQRNLASIRRTLKPRGRLVVVDFEKEPGKASEFVMGHVRAGKATVLAEIAAAGFELEREERFLEENYFLVFRRAD